MKAKISVKTKKNTNKVISGILLWIPNQTNKTNPIQFVCLGQDFVETSFNKVEFPIKVPNGWSPWSSYFLGCSAPMKISPTPPLRWKYLICLVPLIFILQIHIPWKIPNILFLKNEYLLWKEKNLYCLNLPSIANV